MKQDDSLRAEIKKQLLEAKKRLKEKGISHEGLGEELEKIAGEDGRMLGPRNDIELRRLINEIRDLDDDTE